MQPNSYHTSVLLNQSLDFLITNSTGKYVDGTLGEAGHSLEILKRTENEGSLISFDHDKEAIEFVRKSHCPKLDSTRWQIINDNFANISKHIEKDSVDGVLLDLGVSSRHFDIKGRGFSYKYENDPLDMRMDDTLGVTASELISFLDERKLGSLIKRYGEEKHSRRIASELKNTPKLESVGDLNQAIDRALPAASSRYDAYRRVYQALRIAVNSELQSLEKFFTDLDYLKPGARIVIISFHSLEDRIVKRAFRRLSTEGRGEIVTKKPIVPSSYEIESNSRSRSAKMRVFEFREINGDRLYNEAASTS